MGRKQSPSGVEQGDHYRHPDRTNEVVYAVEDGSVLTLREYPTATDFRRAVEDATYAGVHLGVANLSDVSNRDDLGQ